MDASHVYVRALALGCFYRRISTRTFRRALTASLDSFTETKSAPSVAKLNLAEFGGGCRKAMVGVWCRPTDREQAVKLVEIAASTDYRAARGRSGLAPTFEVGVWVCVGGWGVGEGQLGFTAVHSLGDGRQTPGTRWPARARRCSSD